MHASLALGNELRSNPAAQLGRLSSRRSLGGTLRSLADIFTDRWVRTVLVTVFLEGGLMFGSFAFVGAHLRTRFDLGFGTMGALLAIYGAGGLSYAFFARRLVTNLGERGLSWGGGLIMGLALATVGLARSSTVAGGAIFLAGLGFYILHNTLQTHATQMVPQARGAAVALFASCLFLGQAVGVAINASLIDSQGALPGLLISAIGLPLVGLWFAWRLGGRARA